jgi:hypothetical protein
MIGMPPHELLMIFLGRVEGFQLDDLGNDGLVEYLGLFQLFQVRFGNALLFGIFIKDR